MDFYWVSLHFLGIQQLLPGTQLHCWSGFLLSLLDFWYPVFRSWWKLCPKKFWWLWSSKGSPQVMTSHWRACRRCFYVYIFWLRLFEEGESEQRRLCFAPAFWRWTDVGSLSSILRANVTKSSFHTTRKCITHMDQYGKNSWRYVWFYTAGK